MIIDVSTKNLNAFFKDVVALWGDLIENNSGQRRCCTEMMMAGHGESDAGYSKWLSQLSDDDKLGIVDVPAAIYPKLDNAAIQLTLRAYYDRYIHQHPDT